MQGNELQAGKDVQPAAKRDVNLVSLADSRRTEGSNRSSGSTSVSTSRDKMHSNYDSMQEQTGLFTGKGSFDVTVGGHTQLDGAEKRPW